jgi:hypothetical protein
VEYGERQVGTASMYVCLICCNCVDLTDLMDPTNPTDATDLTYTGSCTDRALTASCHCLQQVWQLVVLRVDRHASAVLEEECG